MQHPKQHQKALQRLIRTLPHKVATEARAFFDDNFQKQGFHDEVVHKWEARKVATGKKRKAQRGILILTGALRRSLQAQVKGKTIIIQSLMPYARIHNEGLPMRHGKRMPRRPFIGKSRTLEKKIITLIEKTLQKS